ncbi:MAG: CBS domain-containing protein, partial [Gemmatimonadetes bacterium]|nr:CBS domain-containing protein [Gemmatimonadota bacterium]
PGPPRRLADLLRPERVVLPLAAGSYREAVLQLLDRLGPEVVRDRAALERLVSEEEVRVIPALGPRIVFPHYRTDAVTAVAVALGVARRPFKFAPEDARHARTLVVAVAPREATGHYLKLVSALARLLREEEVIARIEGAQRPEEILALPELGEVEITPELVVRDFMTREPVAVGPDTLLNAVGRLMIEKKLRAVPVVGSEGEVIGMVTDREIMEHFLPRLTGAGGARALEDIPVREVMTRSVLCVADDQSLPDVLALMVNRDVVRVPVVREGKIVGFLSRTDIIRKVLEPYVYESRP